MSKQTHSTESRIHENKLSNLPQALNAAAASLQRSARSREAVFTAFQEQMEMLGWFGGIFMLDNNRESLTLTALAYPSHYFGTLNQFAQRIDTVVIGYTFPLDRSNYYKEITLTKKSLFLETNTEIIKQVVPEDGRLLLNPLIKLVGGMPTIITPLIIENTVHGIINIFGYTLTQLDISSVEAFANHIAIALENADLFSALEASESRQRLLFDQASDGIFIFDKYGQLTDINRGGCTMLGFTREELLGKAYEDLITPESIQSIPVQRDRFLVEKTLVVQRDFQRKDGSHIVVEVSAKLMPDNGMQAVVRDISARIKSENALRRREKILDAIAFAAGQFLRFPSWEDGIKNVLALLGQAAEVSRVYIFKNHLGEDGELQASQIYEWTSPGIEPVINNPDLQNLPMESAGFGRWVKSMKSGENIVGDVETFPVAEQNILRPQGILSLLAVPIFSHKTWWGFIGFDECKAIRTWDTTEIDSLQAAAGTIGAAIERQWINQQERQRRQEAELLMEVTTNLTSTLNLNQVLNNILIHLQQVVPFVSACIFLIEEGGVRAVAGFDLPKPEDVIHKIFSTDGDSLLEQMIQTRQPILLDDVSNDARFHGWGGTDYVRGWMGVPLIVRENVIGYVTLDSDKIGAYGEKETRLAQAFVNHAAIAIQNAQLFSETQRLLGQTQEQSQQLQQIMNIVPYGILLLDTEMNVALANQSGERYLRMVAQFSSDGRITHIGHLTLEEIYQPIPIPSTWQEIMAENEQRLFQAAVWPLDNQRQDSFLVLILQDVTEERANQSYQAAQERMGIVGQMAAGIAHDFNNIMAVIILYTQLLLQMPNLPVKEEKRLKTIIEQSLRASELIHQILDFSRQSLLERKPLNLVPFVKELTNLLKRTLPENIEVFFNYPIGDLFINADPTRIQQIIMNLALNTRDALPKGGSLILTLESKEITKIQERPLPDMAKGKWLLLQVSDNGTGISAENLPHIFEPFFTTKPFGEGTGLGLAQVYGIVKQHEGFIDVRSTPGQGTTFLIYMPLIEPQLDIYPQSSNELPTSSKHETILVVEDNENARKAVIEILEMLNYKTLSAANGSEALSIYKSSEGRIDLILSDVIMPIMDGTTLYEALVQIDPAIKMIMMTGYPLDQTGKTLLTDNVIAWMQKPLHTEQIAQTIYQMLNETNN